MRRLLPILLFTSLEAGAVTKHMAILGGGGEPLADTTIFDNDFKVIGAFKRDNPEYKTTLSFNGGHKATEKIALNNFSSFDKSNHFTAKAFEETIKSYEDQISSGAIKADDQLLIHLNTHGSSRSNETHNIATAEGAIRNYDTLGSSTVSMDRLKNLTKLAEKKGVKLAIIDLSCHSGASLPLANSKTCVITSTGPNHYAYGGSDNTFSARFNKKLAKGKSLDEVFLEARAEYTDMSFPMISSPEGQDVQSRLYDRLTPYMFNFDKEHNKFSPYMEDKVAKGEKCDLPEQHQALISEADGILKVVNDDKTKKAIELFKKNVDAYYIYLSAVKNEMFDVGFHDMKKRHNFCTAIPANKKLKLKASDECMNYTNENLLTLDFDKIYKYFEEGSLKDNPVNKIHTLAVMENIKKARVKRDEVLKEHPEYTKIAKFWDSIPDLARRTEELANDVSKSQQKVYEQFYRQSKAPGPNPCRDFVL
ncbi:MAG TPA: hypothetical protein VNJ08_07035 [Bacteriovoracaceae bacterium]|nr:hypothetical protein [Bacteriovoracaceae bacterium]